MIGLYPVYRDCGNKVGFFGAYETVAGLKILPFSCGRAAMLAGLRALGMGRMDEILVPFFLCQAVLSSLSRSAFPTMTASNRTKAVFVYHQFGFPQDLDAIESVAQEKKWIILNDCANTIFTRAKDKLLVEWGDFSIISLAKLYHCGLGGAFYSARSEIYKRVLSENNKLSYLQAGRAEQALEKFIKINEGFFGDETVFEINSLYGFLPELVAFPQRSYYGLPSTKEDLEKDVVRRKTIWYIIKEMLPDRVPVCKDNEEVIPFAIPVSGEPLKLEKLSIKIKEKLSLEAPVMHFDYARNILNPDYKKALIIGCHQDWNHELITDICKIICKDIL